MSSRKKNIIGLVWQGNPNHENDKYRSIPPEKLLAALNEFDVELVSLQADLTNNETRKLLSKYGVVNVGENFTDFLKAAKYFASVDLIITVDTAAAHLAGAMMKEVWTLLPANPDWRWGREGDKTEWYPTMKLFRQKKLGEWEDVLNELRKELELKFGAKGNYEAKAKDKAEVKAKELIWKAIDEFQKGNYEESSELFWQALTIDDADSSVWNNYGLALSAAGKEDEANEAFKKALEMNNKNLTAVNNYAVSCFKLGNIKKAENALLEALTENEKDFETNYNLANIYHRTGRLDEAEKRYRFATRLNPNDPKVFYNLALLLIEKKCFDEAEKIVDDGIAAFGDKAEFLFLKGNIAKEREDYSSAEKYYDSALKLFPDYKDAWLNLAQVYFLTGKYFESEKVYTDRIKIGDSDARLLYSLGVLYQEMKKFDESENFLRDAINRAPENADYHLALAETHLLQGKYEEGFAEYEMRLKRREYSSYDFNIPEDINDLTDKKVLIVDEQGAGDTINFLRFVRKVSEIADEIIFASKENLLKLVSEQDYINVCLPLSNANSLEYDYVIPIASLPKFFISDDKLILPNEKYVDSEKELSVEEINYCEGLKVGIVWKGNPYPVHNRKRHIDLKTISELFSVEDLTFFSFQKEITEDEMKLLQNYNNVVDVSDKLNDFSDTLALLKQMDLVISVDTAVAHLAGAAGIETWLLLAYVPDWRWKTDGEKTDWYQSVACFRQSEKRDWKEVILEIRNKLKLKTKSEDASIKNVVDIMNKGEYESAIDVLNYYVSENPEDANALNLLAANYTALKNYDEAEKSLNNLLKNDPYNLNALINLGIVLFNKKEFEKSFDKFEAAKKISPENPAVYYNYAVALEAAGKYFESIEHYKTAEKYSSENHQIKNNLGMVLLRVKNYSEGWKKFESRFYTGELKRKEMPGQRWSGEIAKDKVLYVYSDQGYGDAIQFARFLKFARERVGKLIFETQAEALQLFKDLEGVDKLCAVKPDFSADEKYDLQCPLLSLPYALNIDEDEIAISAHYLKAEESKIEKWKSFFVADKKIKIGIVWKGNPVFARNELRSSSIEYFTDLFSIKDVSFYCLQKELTEMERAVLNDFGVKTLSEQFTDFSETAAAIANLDLIITTDTVIPHLAGALGKPVLLLLAFVSDWRWGTDETTSAWYPSVKIIRQKNIGNWESVFDEVKEIVKQQYLF